MRVGMMASFTEPTELAKITALICRSYGIEFLYLRAKDVNMEKGTVNGKVYIDNEWVEKEVEIPPFIDIDPYSFKKKNREVTEYLKRKTFLSDNRKNVLRKRALQEYLRDDPEYSHLVIPTFKVEKYEDLQKYLIRYEKVVVKPSGGIQGKRIYVLEKKSEKYVLGYLTREKHVDEEELEKFFNEMIAGKNYIVQKYVSSRTLQGDPFDCRIHVEKNGDGKWESARNYIRIGIGQKVISNVNQGGGIADCDQFLKANYGDQWSGINDRLNELDVKLPYKVEQLRGTHIMSLGIDVGIDRNGELYVFEVNDGPATSAVISEVAYLRSNYYRYILNHELDLFTNEPQVNSEDDRALKEDRNFYKKEYDKVISSTSWKVTAPLRKIGGIKKKFRNRR